MKHLAKISNEVTVDERARMAKSETLEVIYALHDTSIINRANAIDELVQRSKEKDSTPLLNLVEQAIQERRNKRAMLFGAMSVSMYGIARLCASPNERVRAVGEELKRTLPHDKKRSVERLLQSELIAA